MYRSRISLLATIAVLTLMSATQAADWPMWRCDAGRSAVTSEQLPAELHVQWILHWPRLDPAWPNAARLRFDHGYEPIVLGKLMFVASSLNDSVTAIDTETGERRWRFYADGPIRFAPAGWKDKLYVGSDDGYLYCLDAKTGQVRWKYRGAPGKRKSLGNGSLISCWPVRGAPVVADDKVYVAASIWPFMGVFVTCLDAETGKVVWVNDGVGAIYVLQPHDSPAFAGPAPQGYLAVQGDRLLVPSGRATPAGFDRHTGELKYFLHAKNKRYGGYHVAAAGKYYTNTGVLYEIEDGKELGPIATAHPGADAFGGLDRYPVMTSDVIYDSVTGEVRAYDVTMAKMVRRGKESALKMPRLWELKGNDSLKVHIKAGDRLYASEKECVKAIDIPKAGGEPKVSWQGKVDGEVWTMVAADGKLFVVTYAGKIYCFGAKAGQPKAHTVKADDSKEGARSKRALAILKQAAAPHESAKLDQGYALCLGMGSAEILEDVAGASELRVVGVDPDESRVAKLRQRLDAAGLYGHRVALLAGDAKQIALPPYFARLVFSEDPQTVGLDKDPAVIAKAYACLRPYGGKAVLSLNDEQHQAFAKAVAEAKLPKAKVDREDGLTLLIREGALPGAADWTHQYGDPANTVVSQDERAKAPLGMLWWTASHNWSVLPRHGHGPSEQIAAGRLFIEGRNSIEARDIYTGLILWRRDFPDLGKHYDYTSHEAGANSLGSNFVSLPDGVYVAYDRKCLRLDPATGKTMSEFTLPPWRGREKSPLWGNFRICGDVIVAAALPVSFDPKPTGKKESLNAISSKRLDVIDRHSGKHLWSATATYAFRHNAVCSGGGKVFCIDRYPDPVIAHMKRRGQLPKGNATLLAFDIQTGKEVWRTTKDIFGTWLSYSKEHDLLLQAGRPSRDMVGDEPGHRMIAYRGRDGSILWDRKDSYRGPCMLHDDMIITQSKAYDLHTGKQLSRTNPLTGEQMPWTYTRNYGCNTSIASRHLITFRSAAAGFFDLDRLGGTGNFGGFRTGCSSNLIAAGGLLNAPDYTRTCTCSYQNQASLALVPMPDVEMWTFNQFDASVEPIRRLGLNLGAPGDRMADNDVLWIEYPLVGGLSPRGLKIETSPKAPQVFRRHSSQMQAKDYEWVAASGMLGLRKLDVQLIPESDRTGKPWLYTVRLFFAEPDDLAAGRRVFDVTVQGKPIASGLDVIKQAGGPRRLLTKTAKGVAVKDVLSIALTPAASSKLAEPMLCGVEIVAETPSVAVDD